MAISHLNNNAAPPILSEPGSAVAEGVHPIWIRTIGTALRSQQNFKELGSHDSSLEGDGFNLLVPGRETVKPSWGDRTAVLTTSAELSRNRWFESRLLQRRVRGPVRV